MHLFFRLRERFPDLSSERDFSFSRHTTVGCGGTADAGVSPTRDELIPLIDFLREEGIPYCFLGAGANVLPADGPFRGAVIRFNRMNELCTDGTAVEAGAGVPLGTLLRTMRDRGLGGLEFMTGIPASVGGAVVMNAGTASGHIGDAVSCVTALESGVFRTFSAAECAFSEKYSIFQRGLAVVGVRLCGKDSSRTENLQRTAFFAAKRSRLPRGRSMGCVFVNPPQESAGRLIEACGLKGMGIGGAYVSEKHANFILNEGGTSSDIARLIDFVKLRVYAETGILLKEEIRRLPKCT